MTPDEQQSALKRCLALQPLVGWPEWTATNCLVRLDYRPVHYGWCTAHAYPPSILSFFYQSGVLDHEALCLWQAHFLDNLGEYSKRHNELVQIHMALGEVPGAGVSIYWCDGADRDVSSHAPTLIEALLGFFEQIQKEQSDDTL